MKNRSEKKRLDGNSFLLAVTIILFFVIIFVAHFPAVILLFATV